MQIITSTFFNKRQYMQTKSSPRPAILIIDDDMGICNVIADIMELEGIRTFIAATGQQGLEHYQNHQAEIGLVFLDLQLPDLFGVEVLKQLKQLNPYISVVIMSGKYNPQQHLESEIELLPKPFSIHDLLRIVKERLTSTVTN
jgi:DNA-binding NtrC family response regulator